MQFENFAILVLAVAATVFCTLISLKRCVLKLKISDFYSSEIGIVEQSNYSLVFSYCSFEMCNCMFIFVWGDFMSSDMLSVVV